MPVSFHCRRFKSSSDFSDYDLGLQCGEEAGHILTDCYTDCHEDEYCITKCIRDYDYYVYHCPCNGGCPDGCPCPVYDCPGFTTQTTAQETTSVATTDTTTSKTSTTPALSKPDILILHTKGSNIPVITNASGKDDREVNFAIDSDVEVDCSCSLTWRGEHFVFGSYYKTNQIAKITGCELKKVGELPFDHVYGGCANMADNRVYLCFNNLDRLDLRKCRYAESPLSKFEKTPKSYEQHANARIGASESKSLINFTFSYFVLAEVLTVGSYIGSQRHKKAEIFNDNSNQWSQIDDYPFD